MEIEGVFRPISPVYRALDLLLFGTLYLLFCASGVVMIYAGLWAALHRDDHSGLWILLPTGVFYLLIINLGMYLRYVVVPRRTVRKFRYDGERLTYRTDRTGESVARGLGEIRNVLTYWGKGNGPPGFRIRFLDGGWIWLSPRTLNAEELVARLHRDLKASKDLARD